jgi:tetratricopeptide (TPR) repeat protein
MGKSRTAKEIAREAVLAGYKALWGRCSEVEGAPAFGPWIDIIRAYVESANPNDLATDMGDGAGYIAQIVPEIRSVLPDVPDIAIIDADQARYQLFDSVAVFLRNAARRQPLAIVLDDLHGADLPSLLLLQFVARRLGDSRVFLLTTTRSAAARSASHPLSTAIAEMAREAGFQEIELAGLSAAETGQIVAAVAGAPVSQALVESVYERAGGNPFFTIEIARILVRTLDLSDEQAARQARELIPPTARAAITARLRGVSSECYRLLSLASVIGRRFRIGVLAQAAGITVAVALVGLQEALDVQLIGGLPDDPTGFIFSHALIMGTLYEAIPASSRPRLHEQVGLAMEQAADQHEGYLAEIAHHFVQSAQGGGDPGRAIDYSMRAAAQATKLTAYEDSVRHLETALELNTNLAEANDERQFEILITLGRALIRGGKLEAGDEVLWKAVALARQLDDPKFMAIAAIAVGPDTWYGQTVSRGWSDKVVAALYEAEALWGEQDAPEHALLLAQLAMAKFAGVEIDLAIEFAERAEVMSRRLIADDTLLTAVLAARYITLQAVPDAVQQRLSVASEMLLRARTAGAIDAEFKALVWRNAAHLQLADRAAVDSGLEEIQALADATRVPYMRWLSLNLCASREILSGRLAEGDGLARQALEVGRDAIDYPAELTYAATHQFQECFFVQGAGRLAPVFQGVLPMLTAIDAFRCQFAHTLIEAGDCEGAREHLDHFASEQFENIRHDEVWLYALCQLAEVAIALGDERSVDGIAGKLQPLAGNCVIVSDGVSWWGSVCHYLGKLNAALGRYDRAVAYFERALEVHSRMESPPFIALTQIDYGQTLRQRCAPGDERMADELISSARETAARFGLDALLRRIER